MTDDPKDREIAELTAALAKERSERAALARKYRAARRRRRSMDGELARRSESVLAVRLAYAHLVQGILEAVEKSSPKRTSWAVRVLAGELGWPSSSYREIVARVGQDP